MVVVVVVGGGGQLSSLTSSLSAVTLLNPLSNLIGSGASTSSLYELHIFHLPDNFKPESLFTATFASTRSIDVTAHYGDWLEAEGEALPIEELPKHAEELSIVSRMMASRIVEDAKEKKGKVPAFSPPGHPAWPFWLKRGVYEG